jgi:hypothetical protein
LSSLAPPDVLVLGGGGLLGEAWMTGVLAGYEDATGADLRRCRRFVGTSAGSIVASSLAAGRSPRRPGAAAPARSRTQMARRRRLRSPSGPGARCQICWSAPERLGAPFGRERGALDVESRQHAVEPARKPPDAVAEELHDGGGGQERPNPVDALDTRSRSAASIGRLPDRG